MPSHHPTSAQLRDDIERGRTGDKIGVTDPAAAPLGTDDEAAGTPPSGEAVRQAREYELAMGRRVREGAQADRSPSAAMGLYAGIILGLAALLSGGIWLSYQP